MTESISEQSHPSLGSLNERFYEFAAAQKQTISSLLDRKPQEWGGLDKKEGKAKTEKITRWILGRFYKEVVSRTVEDYFDLERRISEWEKKEDDVPKEILSVLFPEVSKRARVERIHGGYAVYLPAEKFVKCLNLIVFDNGKIVEDPKKIEDLLSCHVAEAGVLLDPSLIKKTSLPEGTNIAVIFDGFGAEDAKVHEEREIIGQYFDKFLAEDREVHRLDLLSEKELPESFDRETLRTAIYDLAGRIEEGIKKFNLASVGITPEYAKTNPQETKLLKAVLNKIEEKLSLEDQAAIAGIVRGGALRIENLAKCLYGKKSLSEITKTEEEKITPEDFSGIVFKSKEGTRFIYNQATLKSGDSLKLHGIKYTVDKILASGGQGVVYEAKTADSQGYVVKELIFRAPEALLTPSLAGNFIDGLVSRQPNPQEPNPALLLKDLLSIISVRDEPSAGYIDEFSRSYRNFLADYLEKTIRNDKDLQNLLSLKTQSGEPVYQKDKLQFIVFEAKPDPQTGSRIRLISPEQQRKLVEMVKEAAEEFAASKEAANFYREMSEALQMFVAESEVLHNLRVVRGVAYSLGLCYSQINLSERPEYHAIYMVQNKAEGESLAKKLETLGANKLPMQETVNIVIELLAILQCIHNQEVVHKDVKPANIIVNKDNHLTLVDFGIAKGKYVAINIASQTGLRPKTTMMGTAGYDSPEHVAGKTDPRSDIYSAGMVLFRLLTGRDPEREPWVFNYPLRQKEISAIMSSQRIPRVLEQIVFKAIEIAPDKRFQNALEMKEALEKVEIITVNKVLENHFNKTFAYLDKIGYGVTEAQKWPQFVSDFFAEVDKLIISNADSSRLGEALSYLDKLVRETLVYESAEMSEKLLKRTRNIIDSYLVARKAIPLVQLKHSQEVFLACNQGRAGQFSSLLKIVCQREAVITPDRVNDLIKVCAESYNNKYIQVEEHEAIDLIIYVYSYNEQARRVEEMRAELFDGEGEKIRQAMLAMIGIARQRNVSLEEEWLNLFEKTFHSHAFQKVEKIGELRTANGRLISIEKYFALLAELAGKSPEWKDKIVKRVKGLLKGDYTDFGEREALKEKYLEPPARELLSKLSPQKYTKKRVIV